MTVRHNVRAHHRTHAVRPVKAVKPVRALKVVVKSSARVPRSPKQSHPKRHRLKSPFRHPHPRKVRSGSRVRRQRALHYKF